MDAISFYKGYCPQSNTNRIISIKLAEVSFIGDLSPEYKKMSFNCPDYDICNYLDSYGRCPLYIQAPSQP